MKHHISKTITNTDIDTVTKNITIALKKEGFGIITTINMQATLKAKINVDFKPYIILGACNPHLANKALGIDDKVGVFLPCNIIIQEQDKNTFEVSAINTNFAMENVDNKGLKEFAKDVNDSLNRVLLSI